MSSRLVLVEDHPDAAPVVEELCRHAGFSPVLSSGRVAAVAELEKAPADIVVSSFTASGGPAAIALVRELRTHEKLAPLSLRLVAIVDNAEQAAEAWGAEADEVVVRPYPASRLTEALVDLAERPESSRESIRRDRARIAERTAGH